MISLNLICFVLVFLIIEVFVLCLSKGKIIIGNTELCLRNIFTKNMLNSVILVFFSNNLLEDLSPFCGATDTSVLNFCDVCPGFQSRGRRSLMFIPVFHAKLLCQI